MSEAEKATTRDNKIDVTWPILVPAVIESGEAHLKVMVDQNERRV
jgi:hypothetical protein